MNSDTENDEGNLLFTDEYKKALEDQLGNGALEKFDQSAKDNMKDMNNYSTILYNNFKKLL